MYSLEKKIPHCIPKLCIWSVMWRILAQHVLHFFFLKKMLHLRASMNSYLVFQLTSITLIFVLVVQYLYIYIYMYIIFKQIPKQKLVFHLLVKCNAWMLDISVLQYCLHNLFFRLECTACVTAHNSGTCYNMSFVFSNIAHKHSKNAVSAFIIVCVSLVFIVFCVKCLLFVFKCSYQLRETLPCVCLQVSSALKEKKIIFNCKGITWFFFLILNFCFQ